jgi:hypothetical protein
MLEETESSQISSPYLEKCYTRGTRGGVQSISSPYLEKCYARGAGGGVQSARRLVEEHDRRVVDQL